MITREQVADIITTALAANNQPEDAQAFAARLATALDALGLTQFCDVNEGEPDPGQQHAESDAEPNGSPEQPWSSKRSRP